MSLEKFVMLTYTLIENTKSATLLELATKVGINAENGAFESCGDPEYVIVAFQL